MTKHPNKKGLLKKLSLCNDRRTDLVLLSLSYHAVQGHREVAQGPGENLPRVPYDVSQYTCTIMRESNRNLDIPPRAYPREFGF